MTELKSNAFDIAYELYNRNILSGPEYEAIRCGLEEIETLRDRDEALEEMWGRLEDVPMDPETECIEEDFLDFPNGTHREEIWHWFDERHSKGVHHLLYGPDGTDVPGDAERFAYLQSLCDDCETISCAYNDEKGCCLFALVHGRRPNITEEDGCTDGVIDPDFDRRCVV